MTAGNILIFAGAGASKAVAPDIYPTTVEFFDNLPSQIKQNPLFSAVEQFVKRKVKADPIDIELVLWRLQELHEFCAKAVDQSQLAGWMLAENRLAGAVGQQLHNVGQVISIASTARSELDKLVGNLNARVY